MNRTNYAVGILGVSGVIGIVKGYFGNIDISYIILFILITIDTLTGLFSAIKYSKFTSRGLLKFIKKVITYSTAILTVRLLELGIVSIIKTSILSEIVITFLEITETVSILENLTMLGVPLPPNLVKILLNHLKLPGLEKIFQIGINKERNISEIEDIMRYQIPTLNNEHVRKLLEIKFEIWKSIVIQINNSFSDNNTKSNEHMYYKVLALIESGYKEMGDRWKDGGISQECIELFKKERQPKIDKWLREVKVICFSQEELTVKKQKLVDSIIIILYKTILDAHRIYDK